MSFQRRPTFVFVFCHRNEEGEEHLRLRRLQLPFNFATGEALLYDVTPNIGDPASCSAPKQRKVDSFSVSPNSLLGCLMSQDQSIYCDHNDANPPSSIDDIAFKDTHATLSVPGDMWMDPAPKGVAGNLMKADATVQEMMDTLQQILGENDLSDALDVEPEELKSWESTLLKMSTSCEMSDDLNGILNDDILAYVEEQLQREGALKLPDQLDDIPPCLATLDLQAQNLEQEQNFSWPLEPQNPLMPNGEQMMSRQLAVARGMIKLTHMDLPQLSSPGLNGPTLQQIASQQTLPTSGGLPLSTTGNLGAPVTFNPTLVDSCAQTQNQRRTLQAEDNNLGPFIPRQTLSHQMAQPRQNHQPTLTSNLPLGLQDQSTNPMFNFQGNQWSSSSKPAACFIDSYTQNISNKQGFIADPSTSSCQQGHFALQTQKSDSQRQAWPLEQQQQQPISSGHQQMGTCLNQVSGFQRNPLPGVVAVQDAVNGRLAFRTPETSNAPFPVQEQNVTPLTSSACMFGNAAPPVPSRQRLNPVSAQIPSKPSCFYQSVPGGVPGGVPVAAMAGVPNPDDVALSCKTTTGLNPEELLVQQQPYVNFSELHTQVRSHCPRTTVPIRTD